MPSRFILSLLLTGTVIFQATLAARAGDLSSRLIINTRTGLLHNVARYAPEPDISPEMLARCPVGHGTFAVDLDYRSGIPDGVRIVKSTGCPAIDAAVMAALRKWCFLPHALRKVIVPVDFDLRKQAKG